MNSLEHVLLLLKTRGPQTAQALSASLGLTSMAVRRQLEVAQGKGLVAYLDSPGKVGRPVRRWRLAEAGHARFPDRHAELTVDLIAQARMLFGEAGLDRLIGAREAASEAAYRLQVDASATLPEQVAALARARAAEGYMAAAETQPDGSVLLVENHCPISAAARSCERFCRSELAVFGHVLGPGVSIVRTEHQLAGARRCAYRVSTTRTDSQTGAAEP